MPMAGYSNTPLPRKLGIREGDTIALLDAPQGWTIEDLPADVSVRTRAQGPLDVIVAFFRRRAAIERRLPALLRSVRADGSVWIAWPRKAAGHVSDISENDLRTLILPTGLVDTKVAAIDDDWSGLRFVWRKQLRARASAPARARAQRR
jgi:hypothetical protein